MNKNLPWSWHRLLVIVVITFMTQFARAQITVNYPAPAENLTQAFNQGTLTVNLAFTTSCSAATVTVALPASVNYVSGSVIKTSGTLTTANIAESNISNLNAPAFSLSNITGPGDITFTIKRQAGCGAASNGKDTIKVNGSCGSITENDPNINTYNLFSPALSIVPPAAITGALLHDTYARNTIITNGGNGCLDTLWYYIVHTAGGIVNTSAGNAITANGTGFTPYRASGDTLFYKIYGASVFGGDNLLCNGETVNIEENIRIVNCDPAVSYAAGWGETTASLCQLIETTGTVTMAAGVPSLTISVNDSTSMGACVPGITKIVYSNNGSGGNAGAVYNITANIGVSDLGDITWAFNGFNTGQTVGNFSFNGPPGTGTLLAIAANGTASTPYVFNLNQFTSDPDGAGTGLEDLDGDGQYDDLAPGKTFTIYINRIYVPDTVSCPRSYYSGNIGTILNYTSMCGEASASLIANGRGGNRWLFAYPSNSVTAPSQVLGGQPFTIGVATSAPYSPLGILTTDSVEAIITLPAGVSYAGNGNYRNNPGQNVFLTGNTLHIYNRSDINLYHGIMDFGADLVYDCSAGATVNIPVMIRYVADRACGAIDKLYCSTITINALCVSPCPDGMSNLSVNAERQSLGWTDTTMTTKVTAASLPALSLQTVAPYDTVKITSYATETVAHNNLWYYQQFDKSTTGEDLLSFISGIFHYKAAGSSAVTDVPFTTGPTGSSTSTLTKWTWNASPLLGTSGIPATLNANDSVWVDMFYKVTIANNEQLLGITPVVAPNSQAYFYNLDASADQLYCRVPIPSLYFVGNVRAGAMLYTDGNQGTLAGCDPVYIRSDYSSGHNSPVQPFPNEYRPKLYVDSVVFTLPAGVVYSNSFAPRYSFTYYTDKYDYTQVSRTIADPVIRGNQIIFINPGNWKPSDFSIAFSTQADAQILFYVTADCAAGNTTGPLTVYAQYFGKDYYYTSSSPAIPAINNNIGIDALLLDGTQRPSLSVQNNTGTVQGVLQQHYWDVQINNTSTVTAPYLWMALEKSTGSGGITIDSVVLKPSNQVLPVAGIYNSSNKWYNGNASSLAAGASQQVRIYFKYSSCNADSILLKSGWSCTGYPTPDPTTYACAIAQTYLKVIPEMSQAQLQIDRQPGNGSSTLLCDADSVLIIVNSALAGNLLTPYVNVYPPAGVIIQAPVKIEYPLGSGNYQDAAVTAISGGYKIDLTAHSGIGSIGLPGTVLSPGIAGRQAKLQINYTTSCGITSGSPLSFVLYGRQPCGSAAIGSGSMAQTAGINITGAAVTGAAGLNLSIPVSNLNCGSATTVSLSTTPVTSPTQAGDTVVYTIPAGLRYNGNFIANSNCGSCSIIAAPGIIAGTTLVKVMLQTGVPAGTALTYSFDIAPDASVCGPVNILASMKRDILPLMCGAMTCSSGSAVIGSGSSPAITINKPVLVTNAFNFTDTHGTNPQTVTYSFEVSNTGTADAPAGVYLAKIYCGISNTDKVLSSFYINAVNAGSTITQTGSFNYDNPADCYYSGALFLQIQDTAAAGEKNCLCSLSSGTLAAQLLPLQLTSFAGTANNCTASINWTTADESEGAWFELQSSTNGITFNTIQHIAAKGAYSLYSYADATLLQGVNYYRLLLMGKDGRQAYSKIIQVTNNCADKLSISASPNPLKNTVTITGLNRPSTINILDIPGRLLTTVYTKSNSKKIDMEGFAAATYLMQIIQEGKIIKTIKLIKE